MTFQLLVLSPWNDKYNVQHIKLLNVKAIKLVFMPGSDSSFANQKIRDSGVQVQILVLSVMFYRFDSAELTKIYIYL